MLFSTIANPVCYIFLLIIMSSVVECHVTGEASYLYPPEREPVDPTIDSACSIEQQRTVQEAWNGAGIFASSHARWQPDRTVTPGSPQDVMDHYLGTLSRLDTPSNGGEGPLRRNVLREQGLFQTNNWSPRTRTLQVLMFCDERRSARFTRQPSGHPLHPPGYAPRQCSVPNTVTYSWGFTIGEVTMKFMIFCPEFFSAVYYPLGMIERIARSPGHAHYRSNLIPWCLTRALYMMQNTYTWSEVTDPPCDHAPPVTGPDECLELATRENAYGLRPGEQGAARNVQSWVFAAIAIYVLQRFPSTTIPTSGWDLTKRALVDQQNKTESDLALDLQLTKSPQEEPSPSTLEALDAFLREGVRMSDVRKESKLKNAKHPKNATVWQNGTRVH